MAAPLGRLNLSGLALLSATTAFTPVAAMAQDTTAATAAPKDEGEASDEIVVTASRAGVSGFDAPTPTTIVSSDTMMREGATNVSDALDKIPAFKATQSLAANSTKSQNPGARPADLRGLGAQRTLVLVNGLRTVPQAPVNTTGATTSPDLATVPSLLVDRVEVVTGGASAQWGSDAVAGVVNLILKDEYSGIKIKGQKGISDKGDGATTNIGLLLGTGFADDRGQVILAADYQKIDRLGDLSNRDWARNAYQLVTNSAYATNGDPALIISPDAYTTLGRGGLIIGPANFSLNGYKFLPGGAVAPFEYGQYAGSSYMIGGEGGSTVEGVSLAPGVERFDPYARVEFELSPSATIYADLSYSLSKASLFTVAQRDRSITIRRDNAFLPDAVAQAMDADGITSFRMNRISFDFGGREIRVRNEAWQGTVGARGDIGDWQWDAAYRKGSNTFSNVTTNNTAGTFFNFAVDSVLVGGEAVCRATVAGAGYNAAAAGCVPLNLFGEGAPSAAALSYVNRAPRTSARYDLDTVVANIRGTPFSTWAGPVAVAAGAEYRKEKQVNKADALAEAQEFSTGNGSNYTGSFDVMEGYLEAIVPLMASLDLNGAVRYADYSSVGSQTTWKAGATWEPVDGLTLRGTVSRDIRAPAIYELYSPGALLNASVTVNGISANIPTNASAGNPDLVPERADTITAGFVLRPAFAPGLSLSADYYDIDVKDAITSLRSGNIATLCTLGEQSACDLFTFASDGTPTSLSVAALNIGSQHTQGVDFAANFTTGISGSLDSITNLSGTYVAKSLVDLGTGSAPIDRAGEVSQANVGAMPSWRATLSQTLRGDRFSLTGQLRYISASKIDNTYNTTPALSVNTNRVPAYVYTNLYANYYVGEDRDFEFFAAVENLFDKDPPPVPYTIINAATNGQFYDTLGRFFRIGVTVTF